MPREIKAIECPKCGSTQKSEIRKDYFRCQNCGTEYILDNDDITITHNVNYNHAHNPAPVAGSKKAAGILAFVAIAFTMTLFYIINSLSSPDDGTETGVAGTVTYNWWNNDFLGYQGPDGRPVVVIMGQRATSYSSGRDNPKTIMFYDMLSGKELKTQSLSNIPKATDESVYFRQFNSGDIYAIVNKRRLFKVDKANMAILDVTDKTFMRQPQLSAGIANLEFVNRDNGDGFTLLTNDGKKLYYYPGKGRVYTSQEYDRARDDLQTRDPEAKLKTYYQFSSKNSMYPDEPVRLMKFTQKDNEGGPNDQPYFEPEFEYADGEKQMTMFRWGKDLVTSYKDLTPGRLYFSPEVIYSDDKSLLIKFNSTAAEDAAPSLQCLDANTGKVIFTLTFDEQKYLEQNAQRYKGGFIVMNNNSVLAVSNDGKLVKELNTL